MDGRMDVEKMDDGRKLGGLMGRWMEDECWTDGWLGGWMLDGWMDGC